MTDRRAGALITALLLVALPVVAAAQVLVAWNADGIGSVGAVRAQPPYTARARGVRGGADAVIGYAPHGQLFSLSRSAGTITLFSKRRRVRRLFDLGADARLEDMVATDACTAYVTRRNATRLLRLDLCTGARADVVDLSAFADDDGIPDLGTMALDRGRLLVQIRRENENSESRFVAPAYLAVIDVATEQLVDVDPLEPGVQAITLAGTAPKYRMQVVDAARRLFVCATGATFDAGGLEIIDLDNLRSQGLAIREADGLTGADLGPIVMISPDRGYLVFTTDLTLSSHLHAFTLTGGVDPTPLHVAVDYAVPALVYDDRSGALLVPQAGFNDNGVHVFSTATGARLTGKPIATGGRPTDLLLPRPD